MAWHKAVTVDGVAEGEAVRMSIVGELVAIFNISGTFYATQDVCTHALASLSDGYISDDCVECPLHEGVFHIPTGKPLSGPVRIPLRTYPVKVEDQQIFIDIPEID
jgi:nitrite reductase/ring-hydroxylating ferredoxin subunit